MNTSQYRALAYAAADRADFALAAELYQKAADAYSETVGQLAATDKRNLLQLASECRRAEAA